MTINWIKVALYTIFIVFLVYRPDVLVFFAPVLVFKCSVWLLNWREEIAKTRLEQAIEARCEEIVYDYQNELIPEEYDIYQVDRSDTIRLNMAIELAASEFALRCHQKFGRREYTQANKLVSRRWMEKVIVEEQDERKKFKLNSIKTRDIIRILDRALVLSFVPLEGEFDDLRFDKSRIFMRLNQFN